MKILKNTWLFAILSVFALLSLSSVASAQTKSTLSSGSTDSKKKTKPTKKEVAAVRKATLELRKWTHVAVVHRKRIRKLKQMLAKQKAKLRALRKRSVGPRKVIKKFKDKFGSTFYKAITKHI